VRTDFGNAGESAGSVVNAMIECTCDRIVRSSQELLSILIDFIDELGITSGENHLIGDSYGRLQVRGRPFLRG